MTRNEFLDQLKEFMECIFADTKLPTSIQTVSDDGSFRPPAIYSMRLPDSKSATKKAPYIINRIVTSQSVGKPGEPRERTCVVDSIFCVYSNDEMEGSRWLLHLFDRIEFELINAGGVGDGNMYELIREEPIDILIYPNDTAPYFMGEMLTTWRMPPIEQEMPILWNPTYP